MTPIVRTILRVVSAVLFVAAALVAGGIVTGSALALAFGALAAWVLSQA